MQASGVNVLLVDDRPENLLALEAILDGMSLNLVKATSATEALKALLRRDFALILMDVQMPGMNGLEAAALIKERERSRHVPIIFLTAINKEERYVFEGYSVGAVDYLFKPFDPTVLRSKVAVFIDLYRKNQALAEQGEKLRQAEQREHELAVAAAQRESELRYRNLAESIPQIVLTADPDGQFTYFNRRWFEYTGLEDAITDGTAWRKVLHPDDARMRDELWREAQATGRAVEFECRIRRADGAYRWHFVQLRPERNEQGQLMGWLGTCTDVDDRVRDRERMQEHAREIEAQVAARTRELDTQKRFVERLIEHAPAGIAYVDASLTVCSVNPEFARFAGSVPADILQAPLSDVFLEQTEIFANSIRRVLETGEQFRVIGFPFRHARQLTGEPTYWDVVYFPVADDDGTVVGVLIFTLEVTDRVENERLQRDQIEHLRQVDTLKDEFLSVISHELRTPLNFIMGFASILEDEVAGPLTGDQHEYLDKILNGTDRMLLLVNDLLDFAKLQAGQFELFPEAEVYRPLVEEVVATLKPLADHKRITLAAVVPDGLRANCDPQRVIQILTNLVTNAIKFTPEEGLVQIQVHQDGEQVITEVEDTGIGIADENINKLFMRFKQLDMSRTREVGGTGLGLCIAKALVEAHGGHITASSSGIGKGATFRFTLPAASTAGEPAAVLERERQQSSN